MSNKLVKNGASQIALPGDEVIVGEIKITQTGKVQINAPTIHPLMLARMLAGTSTNILDMFMAEAQETQENNQSNIIGNT